MNQHLGHLQNSPKKYTLDDDCFGVCFLIILPCRSFCERNAKIATKHLASKHLAVKF